MTWARGAAGTRGPIHKFTSCFPLVACGLPSLVRAEPGARGPQARGTGGGDGGAENGRAGRHHRSGSSLNRHTRPQRKEGFARGRRGWASPSTRGRDSGAEPWGGPIPAPRLTNGRRPPAHSGPSGVGPPPDRAFSADAPSTAPLPGPSRAHPGSAGSFIVLRRRPCSAAAADPAWAPAPAAVLPPARPRAPAAPPRRQTRPAPAAAAANQRTAGAEQAARQARPIQPLSARRGAAAEMGARLARSVKGIAAHGAREGRRRRYC